eukprot:CAMPEP_0179407284 /NCGR_PEP_ID=MMETSP0799-20121207/1402_1 /TAXON_ID=46947 /ORGANISM="Geminigera cryophila, Strain CCMP2564" /LENGTH=210 /DNA_ID=CAMNT_0021178517 /DNA_START=20 /DNA_END=652 /DNA_ORIENTATION=+
MGGGMPNHTAGSLNPGAMGSFNGFPGSAHPGSSMDFQVAASGMYGAGLYGGDVGHVPHGAQGMVVNHGGLVSNYGGNVQNLQGQVHNVRGQVQNYFGSVANSEGTVFNQGGAVSNVRGTVQNIQGTVSNYGGVVGNAYGQVYNATGAVKNVGGTVQNLLGFVDNYGGTVLNTPTAAGHSGSAAYGYGHPDQQYAQQYALGNGSYMPSRTL